MSKIDKLIFLVDLEEINNKEIIIINQYCSIYKDKLMGWYNLDSYTKF